LAGLAEVGAAVADGDADPLHVEAQAVEVQVVDQQRAEVRLGLVEPGALPRVVLQVRDDGHGEQVRPPPAGVGLVQVPVVQELLQDQQQRLQRLDLPLLLQHPARRGRSGRARAGWRIQEEKEKAGGGRTTPPKKRQ